MTQDWFTVETIDKTTYIISEYRHWEETHCYLLIGNERALLIDTGLGICDISSAVRMLTEKPIIAAATHAHWDHIGGHRHFSDIRCHSAEKDWLTGAFPLPIEAVRRMMSECDGLPGGFDAGEYEIYRGGATALLGDGDIIDLGGRQLRVLHTPGHSPGHVCFWEGERGYLFSGDLVYSGTLYANYSSTSPKELLTSMEKIAKLPVQRIFPGHHSLDVQPELILRMRDALRELKSRGVLRHGGGEHDFGDWSIIM